MVKDTFVLILTAKNRVLHFKKTKESGANITRSTEDQNNKESYKADICRLIYVSIKKWFSWG